MLSGYKDGFHQSNLFPDAEAHAFQVGVVFIIEFFSDVGRPPELVRGWLSDRTAADRLSSPAPGVVRFFVLDGTPRDAWV